MDASWKFDGLDFNVWWPLGRFQDDVWANAFIFRNRLHRFVVLRSCWDFLRGLCFYSTYNRKTRSERYFLIQIRRRCRVFLGY